MAKKIYVPPEAFNPAGAVLVMSKPTDVVSM
jgi:hypothetical protein